MYFSNAVNTSNFGALHTALTTYFCTSEDFLSLFNCGRESIAENSENEYEVIKSPVDPTKYKQDQRPRETEKV